MAQWYLGTKTYNLLQCETMNPSKTTSLDLS